MTETIFKKRSETPTIPKNSDLLCLEHNEPLKGICMYPNICYQRLLCRSCRQQHEEKHFKFYEDLNDVLDLKGSINQELDKITLTIEDLNIQIKYINNDMMKKLDNLAYELQNLIIYRIGQQKQKIKAMLTQKVDLNSSILKEIANAKEQLAIKINNSKISKSSHILSDLSCYYARVHNRFLSSDSSFNKFFNSNIEQHQKLKDLDIIKEIKDAYEIIIAQSVNNIHEYIPSIKYPLEVNLLPEFDPEKLIHKATIATGHKGIWWGALVYDSKKDHIISGGNEGLIKVWDRQTNKLLQDIPSEHGWISKLLCLPEKQLLLSCGQDYKARVWDTSSAVANYVLKFVFSQHVKEIYSMEYIPEYDMMASGGNDGTVKLWNLSTGDMVQTIWADGEVFRCLCYIKHMNWLAAGIKSGAILILNLDGNNPSLLYSIKFDEMSSILCMHSVENENIIISGEIDGKVSIWKLGKEEGTCIAAYKTNGAVYNIEAFYHQDYVFYTNDDYKWKIMRLSSGEIMKEYIGHSKERGGTCLIWMKKKYNMITGFTDEIRIWEYDV